MQNVYFISGLGADSRVFQLLDLSFCNPIFVKWITPLPGENIRDYAGRLIHEQIKDDTPVIVGLSFGGIMAIEIAKQFPVKKLILISSAKTEKEIPFYVRYLRYVPLHKLASASFIRSANQLAYRFLGLTKREDKIIFMEMMKEADDAFITWAVHQIIQWKHSGVLPHTVHIHGTADILLPYKYIKADFSIPGGEHLMPLLKADDISALLQQIISDE